MVWGERLGAVEVAKLALAFKGKVNHANVVAVERFVVVAKVTKEREVERVRLIREALRLAVVALVESAVGETVKTVNAFRERDLFNFG